LATLCRDEERREERRSYFRDREEKRKREEETRVCNSEKSWCTTASYSGFLLLSYEVS